MGSRRTSHAIARKLRGLEEGSSFGPSARSRARAWSRVRPRIVALFASLVIEGGAGRALGVRSPREIRAPQHAQSRQRHRQDDGAYKDSYDAECLDAAEQREENEQSMGLHAGAYHIRPYEYVDLTHYRRSPG